jgi:hypothetical protein
MRPTVRAALKVIWACKDPLATTQPAIIDVATIASTVQVKISKIKRLGFQLNI